MKLFDRDYYHRLRKDHGEITSFTLAAHPFWWLFGYGFVGGLIGASLIH